MGIERNIRRVALGLALAVAPAAALAAPAEPLVVTQLPDPDPYYVPLPSERGRQAGRSFASADENPSLDAAMRDLGRAIGQATLLQQQAIDASCRSSESEPASAAARFAREASCRYKRH